MIDKYKLIGRLAVPCTDLLEWARWFETADRVVAQIDVGPLHVSTVFLGLDHNFSRVGDPILFETMVFGPDDNLIYLGDSPHFVRGDFSQTRCSTWGEAEKMHAAAVAEATEILAKTTSMVTVSTGSEPTTQ